MNFWLRCLFPADWLGFVVFWHPILFTIKETLVWLSLTLNKAGDYFYPVIVFVIDLKYQKRSNTTYFFTPRATADIRSNNFVTGYSLLFPVTVTLLAHPITLLWHTWYKRFKSSHQTWNWGSCIFNVLCFIRCCVLAYRSRSSEVVEIFCGIHWPPEIVTYT